MPLPWTHLSPASMTDHFELSTTNGTRAISGSVAIRLRNCRHGLLGVEHAFVHVHVEEVRPAAHLVEGDLHRRGVVPFLIRLAKRREPVTLVRSPIMVKFESGRIVATSRPL